jgi:hypothetical protein
MCPCVNICLSALLLHESAILNPVLLCSSTRNFKVIEINKKVKSNIDSKDERTLDKNTHFYVKSIVVFTYYESVYPIYVFWTNC